MQFFCKIRLYITAFKHLLQKQVSIEMIKQDPKILIHSLQKQGVSIDEDVFIFSPETLKIDMTRPSLIKINGGVLFYIIIFLF